MTHRYPGHRSQTPVQPNPYPNQSQTPTFPAHQHGPHHPHPHHHGNRHQQPPIHHQFRHPSSHHHHHGSHPHPHHQNYNQPARYGFYEQNPRHQPHGQRHQRYAGQGFLAAPPLSQASPPPGMFPSSATAAGPTPHLHQTAFQPRPQTPPLHIPRSRASGRHAVRVPISSQERHGPQLQSASHKTHQGTLPPKQEPTGRPNETCSSQQPVPVTEQQTEQGFLGHSSVNIPPESTFCSSKKRPQNDEEQNVIIHSSAEDVSTACEHPKSSSSVSPDLVHSENQEESPATINQNTADESAETEQNLSSVNSETGSGAANKRRRKESSRKKNGKSGDKGTVQCSKEQQKELDKQLCDAQMLQQTKKMFPGLLTTTIALPPQSFNPLSIEQDTARPLHVQYKTGESDIGSQRAEAKIRRCLEIIKSVSGEAMCLLFNYMFDNYLLKAKTLFCTPQDLDKKNQRGDFDVLIVSPKLGCLVMEIKAVGYNTKNVEVDVLRKVVEKAVPQLHKGEMILRHVFKDLVEELEVGKALALPNVRRDLLRTTCLEKEDFAQLLRSCLRTETTEEALAKVLCADELPPTLTHTPVTSEQTSSHQALLQWWHHVTQSHPEQNQEDKLEKDVCEKMIARLAGHNSKITVEKVTHAAEARTVAQCIHLTGLRFGRDLLREDQMQILKCQKPFVYLTGTPGSGKTLVLGLKGLEWARRGDHVVVFVPRGVGWGSLICLTLYQRIKAYATQGNSGDSRRKTTPRKKPEKQLSDQADTDSTSQLLDQPSRLHESPTDTETPQPLACTPESEPNCENDDSTAQTGTSAKMEGDPFPSIHTATVEKSEDTKKFVRELLSKYSDRPLRILVDEGPTKVNDDYLHTLLREGVNSLESGAQQVRSLEARGTGSTSDLSSQLQFARASEQQLEKMKGLSSKVQHHLQIISERLQVLQPEHGRPPITQKTWWTDLIHRIRESHACIASFHQTLHHHLLTLPESGDPWSDSERSLEDVRSDLNLAEDVGSDLNLAEDVGSDLSLAEDVGSDLNLAEDVAEVSPPAGEPANDSGTQGDVTNVFKAAEVAPCRFGPTADDLNLTQFRGCVHTSSEPTEDASTSEFGKSGPNSDVPDPKFPQSKHCSITDQTDASTSEQSRDVPLQVDQTSRNDTVSTEECLPARGTGLHQSTLLENPEDGEKILNTSDRQGISGAEESSRETLHSADMDQVLEVLDKLEACMLDGSGKLFNVENQMDFVVLSDILSLLAQEQDLKKLSVWSSGVMPFYKPPGFVQESLKYCLRCPPTVQTVLSLVEKDMRDCPNYTYQTSSLEHDDFPLPTDGPEVKLLDHRSHVLKVKDILDCRECGDSLAHYLLHTLAIGDNSGGESGLRAEDVAISGSLDITHREGRPLPFFQALMDQGIPLHFEQQQVASPPPYRDKVFVIGGCPFQGLESKVVVFIPDVSRISPDSSDVKQFRPELPHDWLRNMGRWNRCHLWFVASRCLSQLVVFHV